MLRTYRKCYSPSSNLFLAFLITRSELRVQLTPRWSGAKVNRIWRPRHFALISPEILTSQLLSPAGSKSRALGFLCFSVFLLSKLVFTSTYIREKEKRSMKLVATLWRIQRCDKWAQSSRRWQTPILKRKTKMKESAAQFLRESRGDPPRIRQSHSHNTRTQTFVFCTKNEILLQRINHVGLSVKLVVHYHMVDTCCCKCHFSTIDIR